MKDIFDYCCKGDLAEVAKRSDDFNALGKFGRTPLMVAILLRKKDIAKYLLENNADIAIVDEKGKTALDYAILAGNFSLAKKLIRANTDVLADKDKLLSHAKKGRNKGMIGLIYKMTKEHEKAIKN